MARSERLTRSQQLGRRQAVKDQLLKVFNAIDEGFTTGQLTRSDENLDFWDIYNCKLSANQNYNGNAKLYVPLVYNGVEARKTRFLNTLFPQTGRYIDVTTEDGEIPHAEMALLEQYVVRAKLKTDVVPPLLVSGDVEGQYTLLVTWASQTRHTVSRETSPVEIGGMEHPDIGDVTVLKEDDVEDAGPQVEVISDADLLILPATADTLEEAIEVGGSVTTIVRWTQSRIEELIEAEEIDSELSAELLMQMTAARADGAPQDTAKHLADAAGMKANGKFALIYRTWCKIKVGGERRLVLAYYGGNRQILGCKLCPYWCDKPDVISRPARKMPGVAKGRSLVKSCADMQYAANDAVNEGMDSATYSMLPVIMTDPEKNPRVGSMVMDLMAVWETSPKDTQPLQFPQLYQHAFNIVEAASRYIMSTLGVNAAMLPQSTGRPGQKRNQAEIAMEQQIDIMTTNVEISAVEGVLSDLIERFADYDAQFRDADVTVRTVGEMGVKAEMQRIPPLQMGKRRRYRWFGAEAARTAQQIQQQIALLNVIKGMAQDRSVMQAGYRVNLVPFIRTASENAFGPRLAPEIFENVKDKLTLSPDLENEMLAETLLVPVSPQDDDPKHIQAHMPLLHDPNPAVVRVVQTHLAAHQQQMQMKQMQQAMQKMAAQMQAQGKPPGGPPQQGPRPGAQPMAPRIGRQPPGAIHPDQMRGGLVQMPRRM